MYHQQESPLKCEFCVSVIKWRNRNGMRTYLYSINCEGGVFDEFHHQESPLVTFAFLRYRILLSFYSAIRKEEEHDAEVGMGGRDVGNQMSRSIS